MGSTRHSGGGIDTCRIGSGWEGEIKYGCGTCKKDPCCDAYEGRV